MTHITSLELPQGAAYSERKAFARLTVMATVTATATQLITTTVTHTLSSASATSSVRATPQGGILEGGNPSVYDSKNPIILFIIQVGLENLDCTPAVLISWVRLQSSLSSPASYIIRFHCSASLESLQRSLVASYSGHL